MVTCEQACDYLSNNQEQMIFIMGSGRSGTQLLSDLLDSTGKAKIFHEPNFEEDVGSMDLLRRNVDLALQYWEEFRSLEVYRRWVEKPKTKMYGEVNGTIRYQTPAIKKLFPHSKMLMVVRDARGIVRSVMGWRQFYGPNSKGAYALSPLSGDPYLKDWSQMSRFEKICWSLNDTNMFLMSHIPENCWLQLERLVSDYAYFKERFSDYLGIDIPFETWSEKVGKKSKNATVEYGFPEWEDWTSEQKNQFTIICGHAMALLGYEI